MSLLTVLMAALLQIRHWLIKCASFYSDHVKLENFKDDGISEEDIFCAKCLGK